jgi:hypothetical protein
MEEHSAFVETHETIAPTECGECNSEAHVIRRAPYPFEGLELRTFECSECGGQMERTVPTPAGLAGDPTKAPRVVPV